MVKKTNRSLRNLFMVIAACMILLSVGSMFERKISTPVAQIKITDQKLTDISGKSFNLSDFKNKTILVHFWASWCLPCIKELPTLLKTAKNHPEIIVIAVSVDKEKAAMDTFLKSIPKSPKNILHIFDPKRSIRLNDIIITNYPETFILSPDMILQERIRGGINWNGYNF